MTFSIRPTIRSDLAAVDALLARSYPKLLKKDYPPSVMVTVLPIISRANPGLIGCGTYFLAEDPDGRVLGAGGWTLDRRRSDRGHLRHVATDDRALRRGVGRAIIGHCLKDAAGKGVVDMECWSTRTAVPFYAALGFEEEGPIDVPLQPGITFPSVRMRMLLPGRPGNA